MKLHKDTDTDEAVNATADAGRAKLAKLRTEQSEVETAARNAVQAFDDRPSVASHSEAAVLGKLAEKAKRAADAFEAELAPLLQEESRRAQKRLMAADAERERETIAAIRVAGERLIEIVADTQEAIATQIEKLQAALNDANAHALAATGRARAFGDGREYIQRSIEQAIASIQRQFVAKFGDPYSGHGPCTHITFGGDVLTAHIRATRKP